MRKTQSSSSSSSRQREFCSRKIVVALCILPNMNNTASNLHTISPSTYLVLHKYPVHDDIFHHAISLSLSLTVSPNIEMISSIPIGFFQALCERAHCVFFFVCTNRTSCTISDSAHVEKLLRRAKRRKTIVGRVVSVVRFRFSRSPPSRALSFVKEEKNVSRGEAIKEIVKKFLVKLASLAVV